MPVSPRSVFIPHPCNPAQEEHNWQNLHRLLSRLPLEPTKDDDGKVLRWSNSQGRFLLVSPCVATADCGSAEVGECGIAYEHCSGITPNTKTLTLSGSIVPTGCNGAGQILADSPYILGCDGANQYIYIDGDFMCGGMAATLALVLTLWPDEAILNISIGALTGGATWKKTGLASPYDCQLALNGGYSFFENTSTQADFSLVTASIAA